MASAGATQGRKGEMQISNAATSDPTTGTMLPIERLNNPDFQGEMAFADSSSNDSGGDKEKLPTWRDGKATFEFVYDGAFATAGQKAVRDSWLAGDIRTFWFLPTGIVTGDLRERFLGLVTSYDDSAQKDGVRMGKFTVERTGAVLVDQQP